MEKDLIVEKIPKLDNNNAGQVCQLLAVQLLSVVSTLDIIGENKLKIGNQQLYQQKFKASTKTYLNEVEKKTILFDKYFQDIKGIGITDAINNEIELMQLLTFVSVNDRGLFAYLLGLAITKDPKWNTLKATVLMTKLF